MISQHSQEEFEDTKWVIIIRILKKYRLKEKEQKDKQ
jgi:hypothetical protein